LTHGHVIWARQAKIICRTLPQRQQARFFARRKNEITVATVKASKTVVMPVTCADVGAAVHIG
jgi:hypothetical protein